MVAFGQMADHVKRIEEVERKVGELTEQGAGKEDVKRLRGETKKVYVSPYLPTHTHSGQAELGGKGGELNVGTKADFPPSAVTSVCVCVRVQDSLRLEFLDVKSHVWALEQDLGLVTKSNTYQIR